jgi:hypothetical protein
MPRLIKRKDNYFIRQAELYYQDVELKAGIIVMNYETNEVYAGRIRDSTGKYTQYPNFKQVQMKCSQILFDLILRHKSFNMEFEI